MNDAVTPEFRAILKNIYDTGSARTSGEALSRAWKVYRREYPMGAPQYHERSGSEQMKRSAIKSTFRNVRKKKASLGKYDINHNPREMRPRIKVSKRKRIGKLRARSPLKGFKINRYRIKKRKISLGKQNINRTNPIAVYNPRNGTKLPASQIEIRYKRLGGEYSGEWFKHAFKGSVSLIGLRNGDVLIKSNSGKRLWGSV